MNQDNAALIASLKQLHDAADAGDANARVALTNIKAQADAGDEHARMLWAGLLFLHWKGREGYGSGQENPDHVPDPKWAASLGLYKRLVDGDPHARHTLMHIAASARRGEAQGVEYMGRLKAIHGQTGRDAQGAYGDPLFPPGPGQARVGGYGMPEQHRPGVAIPLTVGALPAIRIPGEYENPPMMFVAGMGDREQIRQARTGAFGFPEPWAPSQGEMVVGLMHIRPGDPRRWGDKFAVAGAGYQTGARKLTREETLDLAASMQRAMRRDSGEGTAARQDAHSRIRAAIAREQGIASRYTMSPDVQALMSAYSTVERAPVSSATSALREQSRARMSLLESP